MLKGARQIGFFNRVLACCTNINACSVFYKGKENNSAICRNCHSEEVVTFLLSSDPLSVSRYILYQGLDLGQDLDLCPLSPVPVSVTTDGISNSLIETFFYWVLTNRCVIYDGMCNQVMITEN